MEEILSRPRDMLYLSIVVLLIGLHSFFLGIIIFFFTELSTDPFSWLRLRISFLSGKAVSLRSRSF